MSDGLFLGNVDYGPLYRAKGAEARERQAILGLAGDIVGAGLKVYDIWEDSQLAKAQGDTAVALNEYRADLQRGIDSGNIRPNEEGRIIFSQRIGEGGSEELPSAGQFLQDDLNRSLDKVREKYKGSRKVGAYLDSTARTAGAELETRALELSLEKASRGRAEALRTNLPEAVRQSIEAGNDGPILALIGSNDWLDPAVRDSLIEAGRRDMEFGMARREYKARAAEEGALPVLTAIDEQVTAGRFTKDQGDQLSAEVLGTVRIQLASDTKSALDAFDQAMKPQEGRTALTPYEAAEAVRGTLRPRTAPEVSSALDAHRDNFVKQRSLDASEAIQDFYARNEANPAGVLQHFLDPANGYSSRLDETRWRIWYDFLQREVAARTKVTKDKTWDTDPTWELEALKTVRAANMNSAQKEQWLYEHIGPDAEGKPRLSPNDAWKYIARAKEWAPNRFADMATELVDSLMKPLMDKAIKDKKRARYGELVRDYAAIQALIDTEARREDGKPMEVAQKAIEWVSKGAFDKSFTDWLNSIRIERTAPPEEPFVPAYSPPVPGTRPGGGEEAARPGHGEPAEAIAKEKEGLLLGAVKTAREAAAIGGRVVGKVGETAKGAVGAIRGLFGGREKAPAPAEAPARQPSPKERLPDEYAATDTRNGAAIWYNAKTGEIRPRE